MIVLDPSDVDIVLVRPARPANVALACRAMKSMGLRRLWLVGGREGPFSEADRALAYGAWDVLDDALRVASLAEAVSGSVLVAATSGRVFEGEVWSARDFAQGGGERGRGGRTSVVFGPEASGLTRDEVAQCHLTLHIPTHEEQPSLNLAQAVLVVAYELRVASLLAGAASGAPAPGDAASVSGSDARATAGELEDALADFRAAGLDIGYLNPQAPDPLLAEWRRLLARAGATRREVTLLRGLARQMGFAASVARAPRAAG